MSVWENLWNGMENIDFDNSPYTWRFYKVLLNNYSLRGKRVLEIGCGTGINTVLMARLGAKVSFLDSSKEALKIAKKNMKKFDLDGEFIHMDALECDIKNEFDLVHSHGVIEHFKGKDRQRIVDIHAQVLRSKGKAVIMVPAKNCIPYMIGKFLSEKTGTWVFGEEYPYTKTELIYRMKKAGLKPGKVVGGEFLISFFWLFSPFWIKNKNILKKSFSFSKSSKFFAINYNNPFANRWGRIIGSVGVKV